MADETSGNAATEAQSNEQPGGKQEVAPANRAEQAKQEQIRKLKLKFGKEERELPEQDVIALAQKGWASDARFKEAADLKKKINTLASRFKNDPDELARALGIADPVKFYRDRLEKEIQRRTMSPQERELESRREELYRREAELKEREQEQHNERISRLTEHYSTQYDKEIADAITGSGLPKNSRTVRRFAELAMKSLDSGYKMPWSVISGIVRDEYNEALRELTGAMDEDRLFEFLGEERVKKVQAADMRRRMPGSRAQAERPAQATQAKTTNETKKMTPDEFREHIRNFGK